MRNTIAAMLAIAMLATSVLIALDLTMLMRTPLHVVASDTEAAAGDGHEPVLRGFYDAANTILSGEHSALLAAVVSPDVETHAGIGPAAPGERGVRDYLEGLRQRGAGALNVVRVIGSGDEAAVIVEAHEPPSTDIGEPGGPSTPRWRTVDLFRIAAGTIVGYWPGTHDEAPASSLPSLTVPAAAEMLGVSLTRIELGPGAEPTPMFAPVPHLLIVETGTLMIAREHAFEIARGGASRFSSVEADPEAEELRVGSGDALLLPEILSHQVRNTGKSSASALSLMVAPSALLFHQIRAGASSQVTVELMHDGWRVGRRTAWDNDTITETLAVKHLPVARMGSAVELGGSQIALDVGQRIPPLTPGKLRLAIVRSGVAGVSVINSDVVPISVNRPDSALGTAANHLFWAGNAFWIEDSEAPVLANAGVTPLDILLIDIAPLGDDSVATPMSYATEPRETLPGSVQSMPPRCPVPSVPLTPVSC